MWIFGKCFGVILLKSCLKSCCGGTWKEQFGPTKNSSARQLELQFLGSSVFRIEKANVVMKTSFCLCLRSARHVPAVLQSPRAPSESPRPAARSVWTPQFPPSWGDVIWTRFTQPSCGEPCSTVPQEVRLETTMSLFCIFFQLPNILLESWNVMSLMLLYLFI